MKKQKYQKEQLCPACGAPMKKHETKPGGVYKRRRELWSCTICPFQESIENESIEDYGN